MPSSAAANRCMICHKPADTVGLFIPHASKRQVFGGRVHTTALCRACWRKGKRWWTSRLEALLIRRAAEAN
jgi:hypothetical protein